MSVTQKAEGSLPLDLMGIENATDKTSLIGDYLRHYERIFSPLRDEDFNFIEIGVFHGSSVRTWERFFSRARIIGVDIDPGCRRFASDRVTIEIGSQNDPTFLHHLVTKHPPRVIIDDGSHQSYDVIFTFERLFPTLESGGIYVIEDLHFHLLENEAERLRGGSPILAHEYVAAIGRDRLGSDYYVRRLEGLRRYLVDQIDRIEFFAQAAVIYKKPKTDILADLERVKPHIEVSSHWLNWLSYSQKLLAAGGPLDGVAEALKRSIAANPKATVAYERLSEVLERQGKFDEAIETLERALAGAPDRAADLQNKIQRLRGLKGGA